MPATSRPSNPGRSGDSRTVPRAASTIPETPAAAATSFASTRSTSERTASAIRRTIAAPSLVPRNVTECRATGRPTRSVITTRRDVPPASMPTTWAACGWNNTTLGGRPARETAWARSFTSPSRLSCDKARLIEAGDRPVSCCSSDRDATGRRRSASIRSRACVINFFLRE